MEDIVQKIAELEYLEEIQVYKLQRSSEYPPVAEYIDGVVKDDQDQIDAHIAACQAVKDKYPKVEINESTLSSRKADALAEYQLQEYTTATARLAQYVLSVGRTEVTEEVVIGQGLDEVTEELVDATETQITVTAIDPVEATVEQTTYDADGVATTVTVTNPIITADVAERATAQAIVDATPQAVIDTYNGE
jgi:histidinol-phosphate/aromatic aminotransferase/cobyric acid decarboxylase-like protein